MLKLIQVLSGSADGIWRACGSQATSAGGEGAPEHIPLQRGSGIAKVLPAYSTDSSDQRLRAVPFLQCLLFVSSRQKGMCALGAGKCPVPQVHMGPVSVAG